MKLALSNLFSCFAALISDKLPLPWILIVIGVHNMERAKLPRLDHLSYKDYDLVYEPSDDTFLLCDALHQDIDYLFSVQPLLCLEIGCGSGTVITYLQLILDKIMPCVYLAVDINPVACRTCIRTSRHNLCSVDVIQADLADAILPHSVDILIFNPPYVPTPNEEIQGSGIEVSWAGGEDGRMVIDRLLLQLDRILSSKGVLYMVLVEENKPLQIIDWLETMGFAATICLQRRASNELLMILRAVRSTPR